MKFGIGRSALRLLPVATKATLSMPSVTYGLFARCSPTGSTEQSPDAPSFRIILSSVRSEKALRSRVLSPLQFLQSARLVDFQAAVLVDRPGVLALLGATNA